MNLKQSAKFNTVKFLHAAKHFRLASLILSQSVIETYLKSVQFLVNNLTDVSVICLLEAIFIFLSNFDWLKYWNDSSVSCGESSIVISVSRFKAQHIFIGKITLRSIGLLNRKHEILPSSADQLNWWNCLLGDFRF